MEQQNRLTQLYGSLSMLAIIVAIFAAIFGVKMIFNGGATDNTRTISVSGTGSAFATPDIASINFTVVKENLDITKAQTEVEAIVKKVTDAMTASGIESKDITTTAYSSNPRYDYKNICNQYGCTQGDRVLLGYEVSQSIQVTIRDLAKVGDVVVALGDADVTNLYGPSFEIEDTNAPQEEARAKAIANAQEEAERLADELGVKLGKMISFSENGGGYPMPYYGGAMMESVAMDASVKEERDVTIPQGEQEITSNVSLTFKIR